MYLIRPLCRIRYTNFQVIDPEISRVTYCKTYMKQLGILPGRPKGKYMGCTKSSSLGEGCGVVRWPGATGHSQPPITKIVHLGWPSHQGGFLGAIKSSADFKASTRWLLNKAKRLITGNHTKWPSLITAMKWSQTLVVEGTPLQHWECTRHSMPDEDHG